MLIGTPKEIKNNEYRIGLSPAGVRELVANGHEVLVENKGGAGVGFDNEQYSAAGARIVNSASEIFDSVEMIVKVKEPQPDECKMLRSSQILFTYLHLAPDPIQTELLIASGATCVAYETVTDEHGGLPLLAPMSEVAGRMAVQAGAHHLEKAQGGLGSLLGGVPGVPPARVLIIGGGVVGTQAAIIATGMGADVTIVDRSLPRLRQLDNEFKGRLKCLYSTSDTIESCAVEAELVIGAVLVPGATAPKLLTRDILKKMKPGAVVVDVAIDQGGCFETSRPTTHQEPTYIEEGITHYCVANMPGGVARTSTIALTNATLPFVISLANHGAANAMWADKHLLNGLNVHAGKVTYKAVADALGYDFSDPRESLRA